MPLELFLAHRAGLDGAPHALRAAPPRASAGRRRAQPCARPRTRGGRRAGDPPAEGFAPALQRPRLRARRRGARARGRGARRGEAIERLVLEPLGLGGRRAPCASSRRAASRGPFAPTETVAWRGGPVAGAVHDENAWALTGTAGRATPGSSARSTRCSPSGAAVLDAGCRPLGLARPRAPGRDAARRVRRQEPRGRRAPALAGAARVRPPRLHRDEPLDRSRRARRRGPPHEPRLPDARAHRHPRGAAPGARRPVREGSWLALNFD